MPYSNVWQVLFVCVRRLIYMCDTPSSYVWHALFIRVTGVVRDGSPIVLYKPLTRDIRSAPVCWRVCVCVALHRCVDVYVYVSLCTGVLTYICMCMCMCMCMRVFVCAHVRVVCTCACVMCVWCVCVVCVFVSVCVCVGDMYVLAMRTRVIYVCINSCAYWRNFSCVCMCV